MDGQRTWWQRTRWDFLAVLAAAGVLLAPALQTGWNWDDSLNSSLHGLWKWHGLSWLAETCSQIRLWTLNQGRINPLTHVWKNAWFWCITDVTLHKSLILAGVGINLVLFDRLLRSLGVPRAASSLACFLAVALVQFRMYTDPVLAFNGLLQLVFGLTLASLWLLRLHLKTQRRGYLVASIACFLLSLLTYETCYPLVLLHLVLVCTYRPLWRQRLVVAAPFVAVTAAMLLLVFAVRRLPTFRGDSSYRMVFSLPQVRDTFARQTVAALPASYVLLDPLPRPFSGSCLRQLPRQWWLPLGLLPLTIVLVQRLSRSPERVPLRRLLLLGALLALLPAVPIAVCYKYQVELKNGLAYLPVYLQYFGVALVLLCLGVLLLRLAGPSAFPRLLTTLLLGIVVSACATLHYASNRQVTCLLSANRYLRAQIEELVRGQGLGPVATETLLVADPFEWDLANHGSYFYTMHTGQVVTATSPAELPAGWGGRSPAEPLPGKRRTLRVRYVASTSDQAFVVVGTLRHLESTPAGQLTRSILHVERIAVRRRSLLGAPREQTFQFHAGTVELAESDFHLTRQTPHWAIYEPPADCPDLEGETIHLTFAPVARPGAS